MSNSSERDIIRVGSQVAVLLTDRNGQTEQFSVIIVRDEDADFNQGLLGQNTPIAKALMGEKSGQVIPYLKDDILSIEVLSVTIPDTLPESDAAKKRKAKYLEAKREVEDTSAMVFASSFSGKWGDYDPDSIAKDNQDDEKNPEE
jgi:hypothetical protein